MIKRIYINMPLNQAMIVADDNMYMIDIYGNNSFKINKNRRLC